MTNIFDKAHLPNEPNKCHKHKIIVENLVNLRVHLVFNIVMLTIHGLTDFVGD